VAEATDDEPCSAYMPNIIFCECCIMKRGFTLIELLVVIAIVSLLMAILMPGLGRVREQAKIVVVNGELYGIAIALEAYYGDNRNMYPPTRADCDPMGSARKHSYALPQELVDQRYLPKGEIGRVRFAKIEDKFNKGCTYKYIAVGPLYDYYGTPYVQHLHIPEGFPYPKNEHLIKYGDVRKSPVTWVLFSAGPRYDKQSLEQGSFPLKEGFPVARKFWYSPRTRKGILNRVRLKKGQHIGTFLK
jgi:prepilin-type N-terminal cleavage/methylation domain-containing protein